LLCDQQYRNPTGGTHGGKSDLFFHGEQSEESLFGLDAAKERFPSGQRALE
jgi:hypothetical protein